MAARREVILREIARLSKRIAENVALYEQRTDLYVEGESLPDGERLTQREMAEAAGVREVSIGQALRSRRLKLGQPTNGRHH